MFIKYGCVTLRAIEEKDSELLFYLINAPEIEETIVGWNFPVSYSQHKQWMSDFKNSLNSIKFMIELNNSKTIGMIMLENFDWKNRVAEIACKTYAALEDRIKGDTQDAFRGMLNYAFNELGLNCIAGIILEDNWLSRNLCKNIGFSEEGILRKRVYKGGEFKNLVSISILKEEYQSMRSLENENNNKKRNIVC